MQILSSHFPYIATFLLLGLGVYLLITTQNHIKKLFALTIFQSAVILFVISLGYVGGGFAPIFEAGVTRPMVNPLPQVLMLTAIVVGLATLSVGLALAIRIKNAQTD